MIVAGWHGGKVMLPYFSVSEFDPSHGRMASPIDRPSQYWQHCNDGAVYVDNDGTFNMTGGSITSDDNRGVFVKGTFNMEGGTITGSSATYGGGVYVNCGTFHMEKGDITDNTADYGGGVFAAGGFNMEDGEITGNHADYGDGMYVFDDTFTLTGGTPNSQ